MKQKNSYAIVIVGILFSVIAIVAIMFYVGDVDTDNKNIPVYGISGSVEAVKNGSIVIRTSAMITEAYNNPDDEITWLWQVLVDDDTEILLAESNAEDTPDSDLVNVIATGINNIEPGDGVSVTSRNDLEGEYTSEERTIEAIQIVIFRN